jgi:hypothetical protein
MVFPSHDLTHYAVESALGYNHGFFGLIADGWDMADFAAPWPRGPIPTEAREVELVVGLLDMQRLMRADWDAEELLEQGKLYVAGRRDDIVLPALDDDKLARVIETRRDVFEKWGAIRPGQTLELSFRRSVNRAAH